MRKASIVLMVAVSIAISFDASAQSPPPNDSCVNAIPIPCNTPTAFSTLGATDDGNFSCGGPGAAEVWYTVVGGGTKIGCSTCFGAEQTGFPTDFDTVLNASTGACGGLDEELCNDNGPLDSPCVGGPGSLIFWDSVPGETYWVSVGGFLGATGTGTVACECRPYTPSCGNGIVDPGEDCDDGNNTSGDDCSATCTTEVPTLGQWGAIVLALVLLAGGRALLARGGSPGKIPVAPGCFLLAAFVLLMVSAVPAAAFFECNSAITISQALGDTGPGGQIVDVTLTVESTDARDQFDNPIGQVYDFVDYFPDCNTTLLCVPNPPGSVNFVGITGGTCDGMGGTTVVPNDLGTQVVFDFQPDLTLTIPALGTPASCTIDFQVVITTPPPGTYTSEADLSGVCLNPDFPIGTFNSSVSATALLSYPLSPCLATDGENLELKNDTVLDFQSFEVCDTIEIGPNYLVSGPGGNLILRAGGSVVFNDGASVGIDGILTVEIDPALQP